MSRNEGGEIISTKTEDKSIYKYVDTNDNNNWIECHVNGYVYATSESLSKYKGYQLVALAKSFVIEKPVTQVTPDEQKSLQYVQDKLIWDHIVGNRSDMILFQNWHHPETHKIWNRETRTYIYTKIPNLLVDNNSKDRRNEIADSFGFNPNLYLLIHTVETDYGSLWEKRYPDLTEIDKLPVKKTIPIKIDGIECFLTLLGSESAHRVVGGAANSKQIYEKRNIQDLRKLALSRNIKDARTLNKVELIKALRCKKH